MTFERSLRFHPGPVVLVGHVVSVWPDPGVVLANVHPRR